VEICRLRRELDMCREKLKLTEITVIKKNEAIEAVTKQFEMQREKTDLHRTMMEWKLKKIENEKEDFATRLADKFYSQRLRMRAFLNWHGFIVGRHKIKLEKACKKKAEEVCYDLATKYEGKIRRLEEELRGAKEETECFREEMAKNEDYMRKALMRGVCALNMEAMSIFNDSIGNKTNLNSGSVSSMDAVNELGGAKEPKVAPKTGQSVTYCPVNYRNEKQTVKERAEGSSSGESVSSSSGSCNSGSSTESLSHSHRQNKELAKKVKSYCEKNLSSKTISAVSKGKLSLIEVENNFIDK
jgi:hypothetical protein